MINPWYILIVGLIIKFLRNENFLVGGLYHFGSYFVCPLDVSLALLEDSVKCQ